MSPLPASSRRPRRQPWTREKLERTRAIALGYSLELGTHASYSSALRSYLTFCKMLDFPIDPTPDTLSFFTVYICHHIKPTSVGNYLSGIANELESRFPMPGKLGFHPLSLVRSQGARSSLTPRLCISGLLQPMISISSNLPLEIHLLMTINSSSLVLTGINGLHRLGELVQPDEVAKRSFRKLMLRHSVSLPPASWAYNGQVGCLVYLHASPPASPIASLAPAVQRHGDFPKLTGFDSRRIFRPNRCQTAISLSNTLSAARGTFVGD